MFHIFLVLDKTQVPVIQPGDKGQGSPGGGGIRKKPGPAIFLGPNQEGGQKKGKDCPLPFQEKTRQSPYWAMASTGQDPAQTPQSTHFSGSIQRLPSFSEIASWGHSPSHALQLTHASEIL
jgi:hypothetical protein